MFAAATVPFLLWTGYVSRHTPAQAYPLSSVPLGGIAAALVHARPYADKAPIIARLDQVADAVALVGMLLALGVSTPWLRRRKSAAALAGLLFAALALLVQRADHFHHVFDFGRVYSPLLFLLAVEGPARSAVNLATTALMYPRIALQLGSQVVGVVLGLTRSLGAS